MFRNRTEDILPSPDDLDDGGGEGEAEHDVDSAEQHVHRSV